MTRMNMPTEKFPEGYEPTTPWGRRLGRPLRIFNTPWHIAHQYELYKIPETEWSHCVNSVRRWGKFRPRPANVSSVAHYEPGRYDLALLHVDQQCVDQTLGKSRLFRELNEAVHDIPKIVINHGTPFWPEVYTTEYLKMRMKMMLGGDCHVVVNSHRAKEMWGEIGKDVTTVIHGLDPDEWLDLPKEPRVVTTLSPAGLDRYYNRNLLHAVKDKLKERGINHCWITVDKVCQDFDDYRDFLGRSLLYFNPTLESPMPRSRTEAMLSGSCVITLANHGAEDFIRDGVNGFTVPNNPAAIVELIAGILEGGLYKQAVAIGQRGKETARELFHAERFQADWTALIERVLV